MRFTARAFHGRGPRATVVLDEAWPCPDDAGRVRPLNILFVAPFLPSPPEFGGQRRVHGLLHELTQRHTVSVLAFVSPGRAHDVSLQATRAYCRSVVAVPNASFAFSQRGKRALQLGSLALPKSFEWLSYRVPAMGAALRELTSRERFDVVNFEFMQMAQYLRAVCRGPVCVLDEHNIEFEILRRTAAGEAGFVRRFYNALDWRKLRAEEIAAWRAFDGCAVTSAQDRGILLRELPHARTAVVPNAVDLAFFHPRPQAPAPEVGSILFFGANNYFPNADALRFFVEEIFPLVRTRIPGARLKIVGHTPDHLLSLAGEHVAIKGYVPDLRPEIESAAVVIAPLRVGGGTRLKILEAMAMARPVVSTALGAEGLEVVDGRDLLLADTPADFSGQVVRLLEDAGLARRLGENARRLVEERYGWAASAARLEELYLRSME